MNSMIANLATGGAPPSVQSLFNKLVSQGAHPNDLVDLAHRLGAAGPAMKSPRAMKGGEYLRGPGDGMNDKIPAHINQRTPAALSDGEFVVSADVVSGLGNGSSEAGAKMLYEMMDRVRRARTGTAKQGKQIKANRFLPA